MRRLEELKSRDMFLEKPYDYSDIEFYRRAFKGLLDSLNAPHKVSRDNTLCVLLDNGGKISIPKGWSYSSIIDGLYFDNESLSTLFGFKEYKEDFLYKLNTDSSVTIYDRLNREEFCFTSSPYYGHLFDAKLKGIDIKWSFNGFFNKECLEFYYIYSRANEYVPFKGCIKDLVESVLGDVWIDNYIYKTKSYALGYNMEDWVYRSLPSISADFIMTHYDLFKGSIDGDILDKSTVSELLSVYDNDSESCGVMDSIFPTVASSAIYWLNKDHEL